jgi:hypothetical protein
MNSILYYSTLGYFGGESFYEICKDGTTIVSKSAPIAPSLTLDLTVGESEWQRVQPAPNENTSAYGYGVTDNEIANVKARLSSVKHVPFFRVNDDRRISALLQLKKAQLRPVQKEVAKAKEDPVVLLESFLKSQLAKMRRGL